MRFSKHPIQYRVSSKEKELEKKEDRETKVINIFSLFLATPLKFTLTLTRISYLVNRIS